MGRGVGDIGGKVHCHFQISSNCASTAHHIWELPCNYRDYIRVMVFYLFCWIIMIILFAADIYHIFNYIFIDDIYIEEPSGNIILNDLSTFIYI